MEIKGIITAMVTPFDEQGGVDETATKLLIENLLRHKVSGIFILGTNGEFHVMDNEEKLEFAKLVVEIVDKRVPVYAGTGGNSTMEVIHLTNEMEKIGVDAVSIITPYLVPLDDDELYNHYKVIEANINLPIMLYNIPKNTGNALSVEVVRKLAKLEKIVGIKDSSGNIENIKSYVEVTKNENFSVVSGSDSLILKALQVGATGAVAATSNAITEIDVAIYNEFLKGKIDTAERYQDAIEEFRRILKLGSVPSVLKYAIGEMGIPVGRPKLPISELTLEKKKEIKRVMQTYKLIELP